MGKVLVRRNGTNGGRPDEPGLAGRVVDLARAVERLNISEYVALLQNPWRLFWVNLLAGIARGMGYLLGLAILGTVVIYLLRFVVARNLPVISDFVADVVRMVQGHLQR